MFKRALLRGLTAGAAAGLAYGLYVGLVATPLIEYIETFESGGEGSVVPDVVATLVSVAGGVLYGILLGVAAFGVAFYVLEPVLPGTTRTKRYVLASAGFLIVSGVPWLVLPPVPPGVEQSLPTDVRLPLYWGSMAVGALACALAVVMYNRLKRSHESALAIIGAGVGLLPITILVIVAPANRTTGPVPGRIAAIFILSTVVGQVGLWTLLATIHGWLARRYPDLLGVSEPPSEVSVQPSE
jgi:predicted cobalt transporter CbtA